MFGICVTQEMTDSLKKFTENTSFHGVQYIGSSKSLTRRLLWIVVVLGGLAAVVVQIVDRVQHYYSWPVNVNVEINYNQSLRFPAVTICNQNAFRASEAMDRGWYKLIEEMFTNHPSSIEDILARYNASQSTVEEIYTTLAHQKEDLFVKCSWKKTQCSSDDFRVILTDHGVCFVFDQNETDMFVSTSGVDSGLQMVLNVEQYEYMPGPHDAAGIKILLHDSNQTPLVYELGQAIPTGSHAFLGIQTTQIDNLPEPYGDCENKLLNHTDFYSMDECHLECFAKLAKSRCGCRDMHIPNIDESLPVCTLVEYFSCFKNLEESFEPYQTPCYPASDAFTAQYTRQCSCPIPCHISTYDTTMSYATMSNYIVNKIIPDSQKPNLVQKLLKANEATLKMDKSKRRILTRMKDSVLADFKEIREVTRDISDYAEIQMSTLEYVHQSTMVAYDIKDKLYSYQAYIMEKNFLRAREAMEERTLRTLENAYVEFVLTIKRTIVRMVETNHKDQAIKNALYQSVVEAIEVRYEINEMARENITELIKAFENGSGIFNYSFEDMPRTHNEFITPKLILKSCLNKSALVRYHLDRLRAEVFDGIRDSLDKLKDAANESMYSKSVNETELDLLVTSFNFAIRAFMFSKSVVFTEALQYPSEYVEEQHGIFKDLKGDFDSVHSALRQNLESLWLMSRNVSLHILPSFDNLFQELDNYFESPNASFLAFTDHLLSDKTADIMRHLDLLFETLHTRKHLIRDSWFLLYRTVFDIWKQIVNDENMEEYYRFANMTAFLRSTNDIESSLNENMSAFIEIGVSQDMSNEDFCREFVELQVLSQTFRQELEMDSEFVRENILHVDIFFKQLSYDHIQHQRAYDIFALICDIGGVMGLCIGASLLTVIEIADFIVTLLSSSLRRFKRLNRTEKYIPKE